MNYLSKSLEETNKIAQNFLNSLTLHTGLHTGPACVVVLEGDLGSGKTAFAQEVGKILDVAENMHSPTFVIEKIYEIPARPGLAGGNFKGFKKLIHIDAYRLEKESELLHLGWEEVTREPENLIFIEWPENVSGIIPENAKRISFKFIDENTREISYD